MLWGPGYKRNRSLARLQHNRAIAGKLRRYLEHDPRWERLHVGSQWVAFKRLGQGSLDEEWTDQPFHRPAALRVADARRKARGVLGRAKRSLRG